MNDIFPLSKEFLSFLDSNNQVTPYYISFHSSKSSNLDLDNLLGNAQRFTQAILRHSTIVKDIYNPSEYVCQWMIAMTEAIKNAYDHGDGLEKGLFTGFFIGDKSLGFGINDGGVFYKQKDIELLLKNKREPSKEQYPSLYKLGDKGGRHGFSRYYKWCDFIEANTSVGTLYMGFSKDLILTKRQ